MAKRFNVLLDSPPVTILAGSREYEIKTDFRVVLAWLRVLDSGDENGEKIAKTLSLFGVLEWHQEDLEKIVEQLHAFVMRGEETKRKKDASGKEVKESMKAFDLEVDSGRIFAAFFQVYRINLSTARLHWWKFMELLEGLPTGTRLSDVVAIRSRKFEKGMTPAQKNELKAAQDRYRIGEAVDPMTAFANSLRGLS